METKKSVGVVSSALIPEFRPSHCPQIRISNASQPTPSDYMLYDGAIHLIYTIRVHTLNQGYNHPAQALSVALPLYLKSKLRSSNSQTVTLKNAFSRPTLQTVCWSLSINVTDFPTPLSGWHKPSPDVGHIPTRENSLHHLRCKVKYLF